MNSLVDKFGEKLAVLAIPCNQFGHQTNENDEEFLNTLKYVRPGNGFEPKMEVMAKVNVNGATADPLFKYVKGVKPLPFGGDEDTKGNGCPDNMAIILPRGGFDGTTVSTWAPVTRSDIAWNFEKFLIGKDGKVIERFSRFFNTADIAPHIEKALAA